MLTDFAKSSTRIHLSVAYLDGKSPSIVTQTGLYENEVFVAFDARLNRLWEFRSTAETNGSGSHHIDVADVDGDGRDEVFNGTTCLNGDGSVRWSIYREHPDIVAIKDILPDRPGFEVYYAVESSVHAGAYVVDAKTGAIVWKNNREDDPQWSHAHVGWAADVWRGSPGIECYTNRDGHDAKQTLLFSASGGIIAEPFPAMIPLEWDGDDVRELMTRNGKVIGKFDGRQIAPLGTAPPNEAAAGNVVMAADLIGDFRDEIVVVGPNAEGSLTVSVYSPTTPVERRKVTRTAKHAYRMWLAHNLTGGYGSYFEPEE
jgi:rhamnogalacturonan endolyase